jgi:glucan 1,3-beta-glucosidase
MAADTPARVPASRRLRGVNLGHWLLLERWMGPQAFAGTEAADEYTLSAALGPRAEAHLRRHRDTWIVEEDFAWLRRCGLNAVRIPFGYWILDPEPPYVASPEHLDRAVAWAGKHGLEVLLDLHGLPGCQGPNDHTGRAGHFRWQADPWHRARSLDVIEQVAQRYAGAGAVTGFSLINEPEPVTGPDVLIPFYEQAAARVRRHMPADRVALVIAAYPESEFARYHGCLPGEPNVLTDVHLYQNFGDWSGWGLLDYLAYPLTRQARLRPVLARGPALVGEWSLALAPPQAGEIEAMDPVRRDVLLRMHGHMLLGMLEEFAGWFFWSYRVDGHPAWCFREAVARGWLPASFAAAV